MIGGLVALVVELVLFPVKARTRLVESLTTALSQIHEMEHCVDSGIDGGSDFDLFNPDVLLRFNYARGKANSALSAAEMFRKRRISPSFMLEADIKSQSHFAVSSLALRVLLKVSL